MHDQPQQVWYLHEQIPPNLPPLPVPIPIVQGCQDSVSTLTLNPSTWAVEDGDFVVIWFTVGRHSGQSIAPSPLSSINDNEWYGIYNPSGSGSAAHACWGRFHAAGDGTAQYTFSTSFTSRVCWLVTAYRGVSKRLPVDMIRTMHPFGIAQTNHETSGAGISGQHIGFREWRQHGQYGFHVVGNPMRRSSAFSLSSYFDYSLGAYKGSREAMSLRGQIAMAYNNGLETAVMCVDVLESVASPRPVNNIMPGVAANLGHTNNFATWGSVNLQMVEFSSSGQSFYRPLLLGDSSTTRQYYLVKTLDFVAGHTYYLRVMLGAPATLSASGNHQHVIRIVPPSGPTIACRAWTFSSGSPFVQTPALGNNPSWAAAYNTGYNGLPDTTITDLIIEYKAAVTGAHSVFLHPTRGDTPNTIDFVTSPSSNLQLVYFASAFGSKETINGPPLYEPIGLPKNYFERMIPDAYYSTLVTASHISVLNGLFTSTNQRTDCIPVEFQLLAKEIETFNRVMLINGEPGQWLWNYDSSLNMVPIQPNAYDYQLSDGTAYYTGFNAFWTDRVLPPRYRLTENGPVIPGKFYVEVTLLGQWTGSQMGLYMIPSASFGGGTATGQNLRYGVVATGQTLVGRSGLTAAMGSLSSSEVIGFAIDIPNMKLDIYRDGSLGATLDLTAGSGSVASNRGSFWRLAINKNPGGAPRQNGFICNFRGPFLYKPTGYAAYDFHNEVP